MNEWIARNREIHVICMKMMWFTHTYMRKSSRLLTSLMNHKSYISYFSVVKMSWSRPSGICFEHMLVTFKKIEYHISKTHFEYMFWVGHLCSLWRAPFITDDTSSSHMDVNYWTWYSCVEHECVFAGTIGCLLWWKLDLRSTYQYTEKKNQAID